VSRRRRHVNESHEDGLVRSPRHREKARDNTNSAQVTPALVVRRVLNSSIRAGDLQHIQAVYGNQAVQRMLQRQESPENRSGETTDQSTQAQPLWERAPPFYRSGLYTRAIILFEQMRNIPGMGDPFYAAVTFNIGVANLRLHRYHTAILYFEQYLRIGDDRETGQARLDEALRGAGLPVTTIEVLGEQGGPTVSAGAGGEASAELSQLRDEFYSAMNDYRSGNYGRAIGKFDRVRLARGASEEVRQAAVFNIGMCNLRMRRYATAVFYFEQALSMGGTDKEGIEERLAEAKRGAGIPVEEEVETTLP